MLPSRQTSIQSEEEEMSDFVVRFTAPAEMIALASKVARDRNLSVSKPVKLESAVDALDAPISPEDVRNALEFIKLAFESGGAAIGFFAALKEIWPKDGKATATSEGPGKSSTAFDASVAPADVVADLSRGPEK